MSKNTPDQSHTDDQNVGAFPRPQSTGVSGLASEDAAVQKSQNPTDAVDTPSNSLLPPPLTEEANSIWRGDPPPTQSRRMILAIIPVVVVVSLFVLFAVTSQTDRPELVDPENAAVSPTTTSAAVPTTSAPPSRDTGTSVTGTPGADPTAAEGVTSVQWVGGESMIRVEYLLDVGRDRETSLLEQRSAVEEWRVLITLEGRSGHVNVPVDPKQRGQLEEFRVRTQYSDGSELVTVPRGVVSPPLGTRQAQATTWATWSSGGSTGWRTDDGHLYVGWMDSVRGTNFAMALFTAESASAGFRPEQVVLEIGRSTARGCTGNLVLKYAPGSEIPDSWSEVDLVGETVVDGPVSGQYVAINLPVDALDIIESGSGLLVAILPSSSDRSESCSNGSTYRVYDSPSIDPQSMVLTLTYQ